MGIYCKNLHTKVLALLEEVARRQQIVIGLILNLEDLFYPSEDLVEEMEIFQKIHGESLDRGQEPMKRQLRKKLQ